MNKEQWLKFLVSLFPEFEEYWNSEGDIFRDGEDYSICGVCSVFTWYFRDNYSEVSDKVLNTLFQKVEEVVADENDLDAANALCTCFLENIGGEEVGNFSRKFMGSKSKEFFDSWN
jgi:hypothetical protein